MVKKVSLHLSDRAFEQLTQFSQELGLSRDEFATLCFEYVDTKHRGILTAARKLKQRKSNSTVNKKNLSKHLEQLSTEQIQLLLKKAAQKKKN